MKVLFAVNNDNVSDAVIKKYQKLYKEIISYKNVYYFNAILKELQNDKSYDRVVISEDLEPFANNNYDTIDKFLFEKLDKISDEATKANGEDIDIILICTDRRSRSDDMFTKIFSIGIYNALIGDERNIDNLCRLMNQPRTKKEAKIAYKIGGSSIGYHAEDENNVSEAEVQNILAHYKRLGKDEDKYVDSFNNIVSQYTDAQLKIILRYLPLNVKAVLEERSPKYQELASTSVGGSVKTLKNQYTPKTAPTSQPEEKIKVKMLKNEKGEISRPIVIPSALNNSKKISIAKPKDTEIKKMTRTISNAVEEAPKHQEAFEEEIIDDFDDVNDDFIDFGDDINEGINDIGDDISAGINDIGDDISAGISDIGDDISAGISDIGDDISAGINDIGDDISEGIDDIGEDVIDDVKEEIAPEQKRGRGRPRKYPAVVEDSDKPKRGRGRPKKVVETPVEEVVEQDEPATDEEEVDLFNLDFEDNNNELNEDTDLNTEFDQADDDVDLFSLDEDTNQVPEEDSDEDVDLFELGDDNVIEQDDFQAVDSFDEQDDLESQDEFEEISDVDGQDAFEEIDDTDGQDDFVELNDTEGHDEFEEINEFEDVNNFEVQNNNTVEEDDDQNVDLFNMSEEQNFQTVEPEESVNVAEEQNTIMNVNQPTSSSRLGTVLTKDKKIVTFVGTTKNGTSFIVNNLALTLASMNISTAILDTTHTKNAYYIFTKNEQKLRDIAEESISNLSKGEAKGIEVNKNLTVYTEIPGKEQGSINIDSVLATLVEKHDVVLIDADFQTESEYFEKSQEIYLVQSMDILTIQPLTGFLRNLKSKGVLQQDKLKIIINKWEKVKSLSDKILIGGISSYNDPAMSYMTELFNKDKILYCRIPFEIQNYTKYLDSLVNCEMELKGYTKQFITALNQLAAMVYPLINSKVYTPMGNSKNDRMEFSDSTKSILNKMKKKY